MERKVKVDNCYQLTCEFITYPPWLFHRKKKHFRDNGNSLAEEVKHKLMHFVKYVLRISCFRASWLRS